MYFFTSLDISATKEYFWKNIARRYQIGSKIISFEANNFYYNYSW